jgi:hypothetical protein
VNAGKVNLGLLLIIIGVAAFAVNLDAMHWTVFLELLEFWPVILIAIGLQMILKRLYSPAAYISCLLVAVVGFWLLYENYAVYGIGGEDRLSSLPVSRLDDDIERLVVDIEADEVDLSVSTGSSELIRCYYDEPFGRPTVKYETDGSVATVTVRDRGFSGVTFFREHGVRSDWSIKLYKGLLTTLRLDCKDSDLRLRLADFRLEKLDCDARYSDVDVRFGDAVPAVTASMRINRSDVKIRVPDGAGVEVLGADNLDDFFVGDVDFDRDGARLVTQDFESSDLRFTFDLKGKARILRIVYY